jgi:dihydroneopterin aldolase
MAGDDDDLGRDELDDDDALDGEDALHQTVVTIEISGLSLYTRLGVTAAEREIGQRLLIDITLEVGESAATETDDIDDTVDYGEVCNLVALVAQQRTYHTLERLCTAIADRLCR